MVPRRFLVKILIIYFTVVLIILIYKYAFIDTRKFPFVTDSKELFHLTSDKDHKLIVKQYFEMRRYWKTSNLGSLIFKNEIRHDLLPKNKTFIVLIWKFWPWLQNRHVNYYGSRRSYQGILKDCSVKNCVFTGDNSTFNSVDAVLIHLMHGVVPKVPKRNVNQIWIFLTDESPRYAFSMAKNPPKLKTLANVFNWSMTYRSNADVPVPYGRTVPLKEPVKENVTYDSIAELIPNLQFKRTDVLVAVLITNCHVTYRMKYLEELQKYIKIDIYGKCSKDNKKRCPNHFKADCHLVDQYYFYLVMENSMCRQYLSEKVFHHAYSKGAIPIMIGPSLHDCKTLLPPNSYLHAEDFLSQKELAAKITSIIQNIREFFSYHLWRNHFTVLNEHGYFGRKSYHLCRLCQALNYNDEKKKSYKFEDLRLFLDPNILCMLYEGVQII